MSPPAKKKSSAKSPASKSLPTRKRATTKKAPAKPKPEQRVVKKTAKKPNVPRPSQAVSVEVGKATDWSAFKDVEELINEAHGYVGREYPHLMLMEDDVICGGTCAWYGFASPEDRTAFILRFIEVEEQEDEDEVRAIETRLAKIGVGPAETEQIGLALVSTVTWIGTLDELRRGKTEVALNCRWKFWDMSSDDNEKEIDLEAPIPDDLVSKFIGSLNP